MKPSFYAQQATTAIAVVAIVAAAAILECICSEDALHRHGSSERAIESQQPRWGLLKTRHLPELRPGHATATSQSFTWLLGIAGSCDLAEDRQFCLTSLSYVV